MYQNDRERAKFRHHKTAIKEKSRGELKTEDQIRRKRKEKQRQMDRMKRKTPSGGFDGAGPRKKQKLGGISTRSKGIYRKK